MINSIAKNNIKIALDKAYNKTDLNHAYRKLVQQFVKEHVALCRAEGIAENQLELVGVYNMSKTKLLDFVSIPFSSKKLFDVFRTFLDEEIRTILDELVWTEKLSYKEIEDRFNIIIYEIEENAYHSGYISRSYKLKSKFQFFKWESHNSYSFNYSLNFVLFLPPGTQAIIKNYYDKPSDANFKPIKDIEKTDYVYSGETNILLELSRVIAYAGQQQIKTTGKGKVMASTLGKMQRKLNTNEFYPDAKEKDLKYLRTGLLAALITSLNKHVTSEHIVRQLSTIIQSNYRNNFSSLHGILTYLKGTGYVDNYYVKNVEHILFEIFKNLPVNEWIRLDNFENYIKYNSYNLKFVSESTAYNSLYYTYEDEAIYSDKEKHYINSTRYYRSFFLPFIKGTCFLFGAYGLLDVAYDTPDVSEMGKTAESPYDGLKYIRLNRLGAFVLGKTAEYEEPSVISKSSITLSTDSLTIVVDEADTTAPVILEPYTERVSPNRFRTDFGFFLKSIKTKQELEDKIALFKQSVKSDIPVNWEVFFKELRQKIDPLTPVKDIFVFQIPRDNPELLRLIAKDATLQKYCLKAEGYHILVAKKSMGRFRKRLGEFGYLLP